MVNAEILLYSRCLERSEFATQAHAIVLQRFAATVEQQHAQYRLLRLSVQNKEANLTSTPPRKWLRKSPLSEVKINRKSRCQKQESIRNRSSWTAAAKTSVLGRPKVGREKSSAATDAMLEVMITRDVRLKSFRRGENSCAGSIRRDASSILAVISLFYHRQKKTITCGESDIISQGKRRNRSVVPVFSPRLPPVPREGLASSVIPCSSPRPIPNQASREQFCGFLLPTRLDTDRSPTY